MSASPDSASSSPFCSSSDADSVPDAWRSTPSVASALAASVPEPYSCRQLTLWGTALAFLALAVPYLIMFPQHADACFIIRGAKATSLAAEPAPDPSLSSLLANGTLADLDLPASESVESTPAAGRRRQPHWFYTHQTIIMIALLATCLAIKVVYAIKRMRPPTAGSATTHSAAAGSASSSSPSSSSESCSVEFTPVSSDSSSAPLLSVVPRGSSPSLSVGSKSRRLGCVKLSAAKDGSATTPERGSPMPMHRSMPMTANGRSKLSQPHGPMFAFHWWEICRLLLSYLSYLAAYFLCNALKSILGDHSCSTHGNSVSGHYLFHCYTLLMVAYLHLSQKHLHVTSLLSGSFWSRLVRTNDPLDLAFLLTYIVYAGVVATILSDTFFFGFHSLRQIVYGTLMAVLLFLCVSGAFEVVEARIAAFRGYALVKGISQETNMASMQQMQINAQHGQQQQQLQAAAALKQAQSSLAYWSTLSSLLHEWFYSDEQKNRFYVFPFVLLLCFQLLSWLSLSLSPSPGHFHWSDVLAVLVGYGLLAIIWRHKLKLPRCARQVEHDVEA